jgi:hypothetical protein
MRPSKPPADRPRDQSIDRPPNPLRDELQGGIMPPHSKPGPKPTGQRALTSAERQARYRARHTAAMVIRYRRPTDRRSRPQRWRDAVAELIALQSEYAQWLAALPEAARDSATGDALQAILDLDLDEIAAVEPPRGFGRD